MIVAVAAPFPDGPRCPAVGVGLTLGWAEPEGFQVWEEYARSWGNFPNHPETPPDRKGDPNAPRSAWLPQHQALRMTKAHSLRVLGGDIKPHSRAFWLENLASVDRTLAEFGDADGRVP